MKLNKLFCVCVLVLAAMAVVLFLACFSNAQAVSSGLFAYITNYNDDTVSVIDTSTNTVTTTIAVGRNPFAVATSSLNKVYVSNAGSASVSVIDATTNSVTNTIPLDTGIPPIDLPNQSGIAVSPNGSRIYAGYRRTGTTSLAIIDATTNAVIDKVDVGGWPYGVVVNPTGTRVYVVNRYFAADLSYGTVVVLNTANNAVLANIPVGNDPLGIAINPSGTRVYAVGDAQYVSVIDTASNTVTNTFGVGIAPWGIAVNPADTRLYVVNRRASLSTCCNGNDSVIDTATYNLITNVEVEANRVGISVTPDNSRIYVANSSGGFLFNGNVSVIDAASNTVSDRILVGNGPFAFGQFLLSLRTIPTSRDQCMNDGWRSFSNPTFKNQGDCVSFVSAGK